MVNDRNMSRILFCLLWMQCLITSGVSGQYFVQEPEYLRVNGVWAFGVNCGLDFNQGGAPVPFQTAVGPGSSPIEGTASVASPYSGRLLFYTDGEKCWNANHVPMPNGTGLLGTGTLHTTTQGACIVPVIDSPGKYYLFSLSPDSRTPALYYSIVDTALDNGRGDVDANRKNIVLDNGPLHESMIAIPGNNCDVWLLVHTASIPRFKAYHITSSGINPTPVVSVMGSQIQGTGAYYMGGMAVSPDRSLIAICSRSSVSATQGLPTGGALLCRFDPATGQVTGAVVAEGSTGCYSACFSPDNSKLYLQNEGTATTRGIYQYDVTSFNATAIAASKNLVSDGFNRVTPLKLYRDTIYALTRGGALNGKIYLSRINHPNQPGIACAFQDSAIQLLPGMSATGLSADVVYPIPRDTTFARRLDTTVCFGAGDSLVLNAPPGYAAYQWENGATGSSRIIKGPGVFYVFCKDYCRPRVDTLIVRHARDTVSTRQLDTLVCSHSQYPVTLDAPAGFTNYVWENGSSDTLRTISAPGIYWVRATDDCRLRTDTFLVRDPDTLQFRHDTCGTLPFTLRAPDGFGAYTWQDGVAARDYLVSTPGWYSVLSADSCRYRLDSFYVQALDLEVSLGNDTVICDQSPLRLLAVVPGATYLWSDGSTAPALVVRSSGTYWVEVRLGACTYADTLQVRYTDLRQRLGADIVLCRNEQIAAVLEAHRPAGASLRWSTGEDTDRIQVREPGTYWVEVSDPPCTGSDTIVVREEFCSCQLQMPAAFSPNGDGKNDRFRPLIEPGCRVQDFIFSIYNRYGQRIYKTHDPATGWDGTINGIPAEVGVYMYDLRFRGGTREQDYHRKGDLTLVR
jgi:gliding motility-associated-like protein